MAAIAAGAALLLLPAAPASAGRLVATGHDADSHCANEPASPPPGQCQFVQTAINYVRGGAPNPNAPLLLLDCSSGAFLLTAMANAGIPAGPANAKLLCPSTPPFASEPLGQYSAIVVGSSGDMLNIGTTATTPDSNAINARKAAIETFFNDGGGIFALSGGPNGDGDPAIPDTFYNFVPIGIGGKSVVPPFRLTPEGQAIGFQDSVNGVGTENAINCCPTHNSFQEPPAGSALQVAERDSAVPPAPETLIADGQISGGTITKKPKFSQVVKLPSTKKCVSRRKFRIRIRQRGGIQIESALVFVNGKRVRTLRRKVFLQNRTVAGVNLRGLPKGRFSVKIVVLTTEGKTLRGTRKYRTCTKKRRSKRPPKL